MSLENLVKMLGPAVGWALGAAAVVMALGFFALLKVRGRERWVGAVMPAALAAGFVSGYAKLFEMPASWNDEIWKWAVVAAGCAGVLLAVQHTLPRMWSWVAGLALVGVVSWVVVRRIPEDRGSFMVGLAAALALYLAANWPAMREPRLWLAGPAVMVLCGLWAVRAVMPYEMNVGRMFFVLTALAGLAGAAGFARPLRRMACEGGAFLAVMFGVLAALGTFYMVPDTYPRSMFLWMAAAPLGVGVAWAPWLRRRPWRCAAAALVVTAAILTPAIVIALKTAPSMDM